MGSESKGEYIYIYFHINVYMEIKGTLLFKKTAAGRTFPNIDLILQEMRKTKYYYVLANEHISFWPNEQTTRQLALKPCFIPLKYGVVKGKAVIRVFKMRQMKTIISP